MSTEHARPTPGKTPQFRPRRRSPPRAPGASRRREAKIVVPQQRAALLRLAALGFGRELACLWLGIGWRQFHRTIRRYPEFKAELARTLRAAESPETLKRAWAERGGDATFATWLGCRHPKGELQKRIYRGYLRSMRPKPSRQGPPAFASPSSVPPLDPETIGALERRMAEMRQRRAKLDRDLAEKRAQFLASFDERLVALRNHPPTSP